LSNALEHKDLIKLEKLTHGIKGASATVGCTMLFHCSNRLEASIEKGDFSDINFYFKELKKCFHDSTRAINDILNSLPNLT